MTLALSLDIGRALRWLYNRRMDDADRLRDILSRLNLSQRALAATLEVPERDLRHLFQGHGKAPAWLWLALAELERRQQRKVD
jgi:hypothetical protein